MKEKQSLGEKGGNSAQPIQRKKGSKSFVEPKGSIDSFAKPSSKNSGLPNELQANMETAFGQDFSNVTIQKNSQKASKINARAFTQGDAVHFAPGEYNPTSAEGKNLIGHEFTHVAQQRAGVVSPTKRLKKGMLINDDHNLEKEADTLGKKAVRGEAISKYTGASSISSKTSQTKEKDAKKGDLQEELTESLSPIQRQAATIQFTLSGDLQSSITPNTTIDFQAIVNLIRAASVAERKVAVANTNVLTLIRTYFTPVQASTLISELLVGSQNWANPPNTDFYSFFVLNNGNGVLPATDSMNCWESILYAAYLAGRIDAAWIKNYYVSAGAVPNTTVNPTPQLWAQLGYTSSLPVLSSSGTANAPSMGDLIFYTPTGSAIPSHVAVYVGNDEVISLWTKPNNIRSIQRISITALSGVIQYSSPPW